MPSSFGNHPFGNLQINFERCKFNSRVILLELCRHLLTTPQRSERERERERERETEREKKTKCLKRCALRSGQHTTPLLLKVKHSSKLEVIIIALIFIEILLDVLHSFPWYSSTICSFLSLVAPTRLLRTEIAAIFAICDCDAHRGPQKSLAISKTRKSSAALRFKGAMERR